MKSEPLKGKGFGKRTKPYGNMPQFGAEDIRSAVEWLKRELKKIEMVSYDDGSPLVLTVKKEEKKNFVQRLEVGELIDKAFEDVTKG